MKAVNNTQPVKKGCICCAGDPCDYHAATCVVCHPKCQGHPEENTVETMRFFHEDSRLNCEKVLAQAKVDGLIIEYDDGRDRDPWFNYHRHVDVSKLRDTFLAAGYALEEKT